MTELVNQHVLIERLKAFLVAFQRVVTLDTIAAKLRADADANPVAAVRSREIRLDRYQRVLALAHELKGVGLFQGFAHQVRRPLLYCKGVVYPVFCCCHVGYILKIALRTRTPRQVNCLPLVVRRDRRNSLEAR